jgi:hypothetical protein
MLNQTRALWGIARESPLEGPGISPGGVFDKGHDFSRRVNLRQNGATPQEAEFLLHRRVELNALTSDQLVNFVEQKLHQIGVKKGTEFNWSKKEVAAALDVCDGTSAVGESRHRIPRRIRWSTD